jgi:hypothetical protein
MAHNVKNSNYYNGNNPPCDKLKPSDIPPTQHPPLNQESDPFPPLSTPSSTPALSYVSYTTYPNNGQRTSTPSPTPVLTQVSLPTSNLPINKRHRIGQDDPRSPTRNNTYQSTTHQPLTPFVIGHSTASPYGPDEEMEEDTDWKEKGRHFKRLNKVRELLSKLQEEFSAAQSEQCLNFLTEDPEIKEHLATFSRLTPSDPNGYNLMMPPGVIMPMQRSSRSHRKHRRTPPASQPVIINTESRHTPPHVVQPTQPQPQVVVKPDRHSPRRNTESPSGRHSRRDSPSSILQPSAPYLMDIPQQGMLPMGPGMTGTAPMVYTRSARSSRSHSRSPRRDVPIVPVQQPTDQTRSHRRYYDDYDSRSLPRGRRERPHRDSSSSSYDRRRHECRSSPRRRHSRSSDSSYFSRSPPRLHYPPFILGVGLSGAVQILPTHYSSQQPSYYSGQYLNQYLSQYPSHYYPSYLCRSQSSSPPRRPPRAGTTYKHPYSSRDDSPSRYESQRRGRRLQTPSPTPWHPPSIDPSHRQPYVPSI